jgi:hypothetical protein
LPSRLRSPLSHARGWHDGEPEIHEGFGDRERTSDRV